MKWWPTNQGNKNTALGVIAFIVVFVAALAVPKCAHAEESYARVGVGSTVVRGPAPVLDLEFVYPDAGPADANLEVGATFIGGSTLKDAYQQNNFALSAAIVDGLGPFEFGLGAAYLQNVDTYNGSHVNFKLLVGYKWKKLSVRWSHFSNGGSVSPNKGRDAITVNYRF